jgi:DNA polymerase-3 subunit epsilon
MQPEKKVSFRGITVAGMNGTAVQPSLTDLGTPLRAVRFCVVDLETTGTGDSAEITEIGAVLIQNGETIGEFRTFVQPSGHIPAYITTLTGITDQMVADAPHIGEALASFLQFANSSVLVAHNARFDVGFLKRACAALDYPWPRFRSIDTVALARQTLLRDEVPNYKLHTLAAHFRTPVQPDHRALDDARATVDVLYALFERLGNLGVDTLEDLIEYLAHVPAARRAKRVWAKKLPEAPGVYWFWTISRSGSAQDSNRDDRVDTAGKEILYVGKSQNLRRRVAGYFTASETRARMDEMVRVAQGVDYAVCETPLEAEVRELRMIAAHRPRYNRRSKHQERVYWLKLGTDRFPRFTIVTRPKPGSGDYWGPFTSKLACEDALAVLNDTTGLRQCTQTIRLHGHNTSCALAELERCLAPCLHPADPTLQASYAAAVDNARTAITSDVHPTIRRYAPRIRALVAQERFEDAEVLRDRLTGYTTAAVRGARLRALATCPQIVATRLDGGRWEIHVIRYAMLAAARRVPVGEDPLRLGAETETAAATVLPAIPGLPAGSVEEAERCLAWLESPGVRLLQITGEWSVPIHSGISATQLPGLIKDSR